MSNLSTLARDRRLYVVLVFLVIALGLASRKYAAMLPPELGKYPGDALWALMVFLILGAVLRRSSTRSLSFLALAISLAVELSQLYQADWLNEVRRTTLGHLVLGSGFHPQDLAAYAFGVAAGGLAEKFFAWTRR